MGGTAKVFMSGGSQAIRIPAEFRVEGKELRIRKEGAALILEPLDLDEWAWLDDLPKVSGDYERAVKAGRHVQQLRDGLEETPDEIPAGHGRGDRRAKAKGTRAGVVKKAAPR